MRSQKGFSSIAIIALAAVILVIVIVGIILFTLNSSQNKNSKATPETNNAPSTRTSSVGPSEGTSTVITNRPTQSTQSGNINPSQGSSATSSAQNNTPVSQTGPETYTNINYKFSLRYPRNYKFQESFRNYFYIDTNEDPNERVFMFTWTKDSVTAAGNIDNEKITLSVYNEGFEPSYRFDKDSKVDSVKIDGQDIMKRYGSQGRIINVGPISHNGRTLVFQYESSNPAADQTTFNTMLSSMRLLK